jgi:DHA1 family tetracycline resistance protein-like MFS transporter
VSIGCFGLLHAIAQAFVAGPMTTRWGERFALVVGVATDSVASVPIRESRAACKAYWRA